MRRDYITLLLLAILMIFSTVPAQAATVYEVERGDTLWGIAQEWGVPVQVIIQQNEISNPTQLYVGQPLVVRISVEYGDSQESGQYTNYTVRLGDSLWLIANEYDTTVEELAAINDLTSYNLNLGQTLIVPGEELAEDSGSEVTYGYYTVKRGDILWTIAQNYDTTVQELVTLNNIETAYDLYVGRQLIILESNSQADEQEEANYYTVQPGDMLWTIAQEYGTTVQKLVELNDIKSAYDLYVGRRLLVVDNEFEAVEELLYYVYKVEENEGLADVVDKFGISIYTLLNENDLTEGAEVTTGKELIIPVNEATKLDYEKWASAKLNNYYRVRNNQTLADIAAYFNLQESILRITNNLDSEEAVSVGQRLLMPINSALFDRHQLDKTKGEKYLFDIAVEQGITVKSLLKANYWADSNLKLSPGTTVLIPLTEASKTEWIKYQEGKPINPWFS